MTFETKVALGIDKSSGERDKNLAVDKTILDSLPITVEISLKTEDGYDLILEIWKISVDRTSNLNACRPLHSVYSSFGLMLKGLLSVTRNTPAYKLARRQKYETYEVLHSIRGNSYHPDLNQLGKCFS